MEKRLWVVYLIRCSDESLYCGTTNDLKNRLIAHNSGRGAKYTRSRRPVELVAASSEMTKSDALKLEYRVKQVPASKKHFELTKEENKMTKKLKKDLQAISKELQVFADKIERWLKMLDKYEKPKVKPVKAKAVKKILVKKAKPATAADTVFAIINRYKKGVSNAALMEKTGYNQKKISNLVYKLGKQGKIKSVSKGVYVSA